MFKLTAILVTAIIAVLAIAGVASAGVASADNGIEWTWVPAVEIDTIEDVDFLYTDNGICTGLTYNADSRDWVMVTITGDYSIEYEIALVDWTNPIKCERVK